MSKMTRFVRNHHWPVGDYAGLSADALVLLEFLRIEADRRTGRIDISASHLECWKVVHGWCAADYADALDELDV